jgi:hypothetical protein
MTTNPGPFLEVKTIHHEMTDLDVRSLPPIGEKSSVPGRRVGRWAEARLKVTLDLLVGVF